MEIKKGISVIICCYNSATRLPETLSFFQRQIITPGLSWELIIVDNASSDNTTAVASECLKKLVHNNFTGRIVAEPQPGLSAARKKGVMEAGYEYIVFCDDDNWLDEKYIARAFGLMEENVHAGAIGGAGTPVFEAPAPVWFNKYASSFALGPQGNSNRDTEDITNTRGYVYGAAAVFRKQALQQLWSSGYELVCSDRTGTALTSAGDNELCYCLILLGYSILYSPDLQFQHFIPQQRLTKSYLMKLNYSFGYSKTLLLPYGVFLQQVPERKIRWGYQVLVNIYLLASVNFFKQIGRRGVSFFDWKVALYNRMGVFAALLKYRNKMQDNLLLLKNFYNKFVSA
jgi:glycosyltransferase involved in cell wall biosynthesis